MEFKAKNFRLPVPMADIWDRFFNPKGARVSSRHAAGAVFLYWIMHPYIRDIAVRAALQEDPEEARRWFLKELFDFEQAAPFARAVAAAVANGTIQQEELPEKKVESRSGSR